MGSHPSPFHPSPSSWRWRAMAPSPSGSQGRCRRGKRAAVEEDCRSRRLDRAKPSQARSRLRCYLESTPAVNLPSRAHWLGRGGFFWRSLIEARQYVPSTQWQKWCRKWVKRSLRDIQKLMKMASAEDPEEALSVCAPKPESRWHRPEEMRPTLDASSLR